MIDIPAIVREIGRTDPRRITVVYHDNCSDGFTAAWAAAQAFGRQIKLVPAQHSVFDHRQLDGDHLIVADYSFDLQTLLELQRRFKHVLVLDHHKTHAKDLAEFGSAVYDVNRSGAGIVWDTLVGGQRRRLIDYVEDRDLWRRKLPFSDEISGVVETTQRTLDCLDELAEKLEKDFDATVAEGIGIQKFKNHMVGELLKRARIVNIGGYEVPSVNANRCFASELGNALARGQPFAAVWAQGPSGTFTYSLRSTDEGIDCGVVAEKYGGGGHRNAAGFVADKILDKT